MNQYDILNHTLSALVDSQKLTDASMDSLAVGLARLQRTLDGNKPKRKDNNPIREIVRTLEIDCIVRYRVEMDVIDDELPNVYDVEIVGPAPGRCLESTIEMLESELPVEEAEAESKRLAERGDDRDDRGDWEHDQRRDRDMLREGK